MSPSWSRFMAFRLCAFWRFSHNALLAPANTFLNHCRFWLIVDPDRGDSRARGQPAGRRQHPDPRGGRHDDHAVERRPPGRSRRSAASRDHDRSGRCRFSARLWTRLKNEWPSGVVEHRKRHIAHVSLFGSAIYKSASHLRTTLPRRSTSPARSARRKPPRREAPPYRPQLASYHGGTGS